MRTTVRSMVWTATPRIASCTISSTEGSCWDREPEQAPDIVSCATRFHHWLYAPAHPVELLQIRLHDAGFVTNTDYPRVSWFERVSGGERDIAPGCDGRLL